MRIKTFCLMFSAIAATGVYSTAAADNGEYRNPVISQSAPDPTVIRAEDGKYYLYATENVRNLPIFRSDNLIDWEFVGTAFTEETRPQMVPDGSATRGNPPTDCRHHD